MPTPNPPTTTPHQPERTCVACRSKRPQPELWRITGSAAQGWRITGAGQRRRSGRGAYVCADSPECWQAKRLGRAFRGQAAVVAEQLLAHAQAQDTQADATLRPNPATGTNARPPEAYAKAVENGAETL